MLGQRRRYAYINGNYSGRGQKENNTLQKKRIKQLQQQNKNILQDTTNQFKKFQTDLLRVQQIIINKENTIKQLQGEKQKNNEQKSILISALKQKDMIINQLQKKLKELLQNQIMLKSRDLKPINQNNQSQQSSYDDNIMQQQSQTVNQIQIDQSGIQTQKQFYQQGKIQQQQYKNKYQQILDKALKLQDQVYKLKQQLFTSNSQLSLVKQQFSTYKLLKEIQDVQNQ